jgi:hypothetical protein
MQGRFGPGPHGDDQDREGDSSAYAARILARKTRPYPTCEDGKKHAVYSNEDELARSGWFMWRYVTKHEKYD